MPKAGLQVLMLQVRHKPVVMRNVWDYEGRKVGPEVLMKVSELIGSRKEVFSITEETTVMDAAKYLREKQVRSVGVMNSGGKLAGVVSQSDISDKVAAENRCPAWMKVSEIMSRDLVTVTPEMTFEDSLRSMEQNGVYHFVDSRFAESLSGYVVRQRFVEGAGDQS
jgi:CBS domain-containing protein